MLISSFRWVHLEAKANRVKRFLIRKSNYQRNGTKISADLLNYTLQLISCPQHKGDFIFPSHEGHLEI